MSKTFNMLVVTEEDLTMFVWTLLTFSFCVSLFLFLIKTKKNNLKQD
jgi:hypothetical protein